METPTSNNGSSGTAPAGQGPGSGAALEAALTSYLASQLAQAQAGASPMAMPMPPQQSVPQVQVVEVPKGGGGNLPVLVAVGAAGIGIVSGLAYLMDRHRAKKGGK